MNNDIQLPKNYRTPFNTPDVSIPEVQDAELVSATESTRTQSWGWLPALSLTSASGLLLVAIANTLSRSIAGQDDGLLWAGLLIMIAHRSPIGLSRTNTARTHWPDHFDWIGTVSG